MDILGIGPLELLFIVIIALIVFGPKDMVKAGRTIGRFLRQVITSPTWLAVQQTSKELRNLPNKLIRDAGIEEDIKDLNRILPDKEDLIPKLSINNKSGESKNKLSKERTEKIVDGAPAEWITPPPDHINPDQQNPT